jgi:hypothetical protein
MREPRQTLKRQHNKGARRAEPGRMDEVRSDAKSVRLDGSFGLSLQPLFVSEWNQAVDALFG